MAESHQAKGKRLRGRWRAGLLNKQAKAISRLSQSSLEYLMIVAITFAIIVPTTYLFFQYSKESSHEIIDSQVTVLGRGIVDSAETIFYSGEGSRTILELNMPEGVNDILIIDGKELVFSVTTSFGASEIVFFSRVNITTSGENCNSNVCRIPGLAQEGLKNLRLEALNKNSVDIRII